VRRRLLVTLAFASALVVGACGGDSAVSRTPASPAVVAEGQLALPTGADGAVASPAGTRGSAEAAMPPRRAASAGSDHAVVDAPAASTSGSDAAFAWGDPLALTVAVEPACAVLGSTFTVVVGTAPHASLAMAIEYADKGAHGSMTISDVDASGGHRWRVAVPADAPHGPARALVSAQLVQDGATRNAAAEAPLEIRAIGGCT